MTATIPAVPRPRGELTEAMVKQIARATERRDAAERAFRQTVVEALGGGASFREVSDLTGLSTNTLQRWKRESQS